MKDVLASLEDVASEQFKMPLDILVALKANAPAWKNFQSCFRVVIVIWGAKVMCRSLVIRWTKGKGGKNY